MSDTIMFRCKCGAGAVMFCSKDRAAEWADDIAELIAEGYELETISAEEVRSGKHRLCGCEMDPERSEQIAAGQLQMDLGVS